jgi:hypothetical protein
LSDLRHKSPDELRKVIAYEGQMIEHNSLLIQRLEQRLKEAQERVEWTKEELGKHRMWRNGHHQRLVWAKNYLLTKNSD